MKYINKLFGGINLSWKKLILLSVLAGVYTAVITLIPALKYTSFHTIAVTYEVWILFGIIIIMNSKSHLDSALKCFVFFLISQPLVYLIQVPFNELGWGLFGYYKFWFIMTIACFPMGFVGYFIKKGKWFGYLILLPMILLTAVSYRTYLSYFTFDRPCYLLICIFCISATVIYPLAIFKGKAMKTIGISISTALIIVVTVITFLNPYVYSTEILGSVNGEEITDEYSVRIEDEKYGEVRVAYLESLEAYMVQADFRRSGQTNLIITTPEGETKTYHLTIEHDTFKIDG